MTAARRDQPDAGHRDISRVSIATAINRREVTRLSEHAPRRRPLRMSPATQVDTHWLSHPEYRGVRGRVRKLPRQGPAPSIEALAQGVTRDVHPRAMLDDLVRLGLARLSDDGEWVEVSRDSVVAGQDVARKLGLVAANVGDHLYAAIDNVLGTEPRHFEQALFSNEVSQATTAPVRELTRSQWTAVMAGLVPAIGAMIEADRNAGRDVNHRLRVGLYTCDEPTADQGDGPSNPSK